jgi:hypothetical protein
VEQHANTTTNLAHAQQETQFRQRRNYTELYRCRVHNRFTAPFWGGFDGFDITKPDPLYNDGMSAGDTEDTSYIVHTYRRAIDTVSDPEFINMNLLAVPGLD